MAIVDDYTRYGFPVLLKDKAKTFEKFKNWLCMVESTTLGFLPYKVR